MKFLKGFLIVVIAFIPWLWQFFFPLFITPFFGETVGKASVFVVAFITFIIGLRAFIKGYGRQEPSEGLE